MSNTASSSNRRETEETVTLCSVCRQPGASYSLYGEPAHWQCRREVLNGTHWTQTSNTADETVTDDTEEGPCPKP